MPASSQGVASSSCSASHTVSSSESSDVPDKASIAERIGGFYLLLLDRQLEEGAKHRTTCATGQQHALLEPLHLNYLDENMQPCEGAFNSQTAILNQITAYLAERLAGLSFKARLDWVEHQSQGSDEKGPVIAFLSQQAAKQGDEATWQTGLRRFLEKKCGEFGLNPVQPEVAQVITDNLNNLDYMSLPVAQSAKEQLQVEVLNLSSRLKAVDSTVNPPLLQGRNLVIQSLQWQIHARVPLSVAVLRSVLTTEDCLKRLLAYPRSMLICGKDEARFKASRESLAYELLAYYQALLNTALKADLASGLIAAKKAFSAEEKGFKDKLHTEITVNFFASLPESIFFNFNDTDFTEAWQRILSLGANCARHPSILTDDVLAAWESNCQEVVFLQSGNGRIRVLEERLYVSTYQVNRILLHALLVKPGEWSEVFKRNLSRLLPWLLQPVTEEDGPALSSLKCAYPFYFLANVYLQLLLEQAGLEAEENLKPCIQCLLTLNPKEAVYKSNLLAKLLKNENLSETTVRFVFEKLKECLGLLIRCGYQLSDLLSNQHLINEQRQLVLDAVKDRLESWIYHGSVLTQLLRNSNLSEEQRQLIWDTVKDKLGSWIYSWLSLYGLLINSKLSKGQRQLVLEAVKDKLGAWITSRNLLERLLNINELSDRQRQLIKGAATGNKTVSSATSSSWGFFSRVIAASSSSNVTEQQQLHRRALE